MGFLIIFFDLVSYNCSPFDRPASFDSGVFAWSVLLEV
jgi:hypothetical protein